VTISTPKSTVPTGGGPINSGPSFEVVRRGYDRDQVDAQLRDMRERLSAAENARQAAEKRATAEQAEKRPARENTGPSQESFGYRAEKILRLAEHEAADVRSRAASERRHAPTPPPPPIPPRWSSRPARTPSSTGTRWSSR
jgi:hypothetical protein